MGLRILLANIFSAYFIADTVKSTSLLQLILDSEASSQILGKYYKLNNYLLNE